MNEDNKCIICGRQLTSERVIENWATCEECAINKNWLDSQDIDCPSCSRRLVWLIHSPFYDEHFLYCDSCPRHVEVSFYDPHLAPIRKKHKVGDTTGSDWEAYFNDIENQLQKCPCGGTFRNSAPRRCPYCSAIISENEKDRDVFPKDENFNLDTLVIQDNIWK